MTEGLLSKLRKEFDESMLRVRQRQREIEIELHPEKRHWDERLWQMDEYFGDLRELYLGCVLAPVSAFMTSFAYNIDCNELGNLFGLGTIATTIFIWNTYQKIRKSPFYNS